ncbi:hypothetical protein BPOR_0883g00030 [Botrytis porri]|uniref:Uncharacterized protein n=1 Tax=Botrytis porri TaxID=87229 RepID=A0A4Z1KDE6_9HELO|nr:hypothetical protein BPOR_0883g00030 [Botrytis porri]
MLVELRQFLQHSRENDGAKEKWQNLLPTVIKTLSSSSSVETEVEKISFKSWIQKVEEIVDQQSFHSTEETNAKETHFNRLVELNPAIKLTHLYRAEERKKEGKEWETGAQMQSEKL